MQTFLHKFLIIALVLVSNVACSQTGEQEIPNKHVLERGKPYISEEGWNREESEYYTIHTMHMVVYDSTVYVRFDMEEHYESYYFNIIEEIIDKGYHMLTLMPVGVKKEDMVKHIVLYGPNPDNGDLSIIHVVPKYKIAEAMRVKTSETEKKRKPRYKRI